MESWERISHILYCDGLIKWLLRRIIHEEENHSQIFDDSQFAFIVVGMFVVQLDSVFRRD